jgi:23S rRNA (uracil1939-C5)-methyltransferase
VVKRRRVEQAIAGYTALEDIAVEAVASAPERTDYRIRAKLMVAAALSPDPAEGESISNPVIGLYARTDNGERSARTGSRRAERVSIEHEVVDIPDCRVLHPVLRQAVSRLRAALGDGSARADLAPVGAGGCLSAIDLRFVESPRPDEKGILITLVLEGRGPLDPARSATLIDIVRRCGPVLGIAINYRSAGAPQVLGPKTDLLWGVSSAPDRTGKAYHLATYGSFVQAHRGQSERMVELLIDQLATRQSLSGARILDLYGGSGAMSLPLANLGASVTLVEAFAPAAEAAERAAQEQGFTSVDVRTGDAAALAQALAQAGERFDVVIANPPRRGLSPGVRQAIGRLAPLVVAYVSCEPETLARDLADLAWLGYRADALYPVDMIPLTEHVEIVALLERRLPPSPRVLHDDGDVRAVAKRAYSSPDARESRFWRLLWSPDADESGALVFGKQTLPTSNHGERPEFLTERVALVRGVTRKRGFLGTTQYERIDVAGGHSLVRWSTREPGSRVRRALARIGHPVVGDSRYGDRPTNRHFEEKHTLDRPFVHCTKVEVTRRSPRAEGVRPNQETQLVIHCPLADELAAVLAKFGIDAAKRLMVG